MGEPALQHTAPASKLTVLERGTQTHNGLARDVRKKTCRAEEPSVWRRRPRR